MRAWGSRGLAHCLRSLSAFARRPVKGQRAGKGQGPTQMAPVAFPGWPMGRDGKFDFFPADEHSRLVDSGGALEFVAEIVPQVANCTPVLPLRVAFHARVRDLQRFAGPRFSKTQWLPSVPGFHWRLVRFLVPSGSNGLPNFGLQPTKDFPFFPPADLRGSFRGVF